jgi:hypothetical protein
MTTVKKMMAMTALVGCVVMLLAGCLAENKLKLAVETANRMCPVSMGAAGDLESIDYEDGMVVYTLAINEQMANIAAMRENPEVMKRTVISNFINPSPELKVMHDLILDANASVKYVYKGKDSGETFEMMFTADELKTAEDNTGLTADDKLNADIEATNMQLPMTVDEVTILKSLSVEGNYVVYLYQIDESMVELNAIKDNIETFKGNVKESLKDGGPVVQAFISKVLEAGKNIKYRYVGNETGQRVEFVFSTDDLKDLL